MANSYVPNIENMNNSKIKSAPTLAREGSVRMIVLKIILRNLAFLISLKTLPILKALAMVVCLGPTEADEDRPIIKVMYEIRTMVKSKIFQPYLK